ncbi:uncharacterized protein Z520_05280 [Fonsecaea multimorphosa CBS 102226]|uniref:Uncharacterized protein n=1 Tax=Fonsecaea multimorphosa CBS 102226 TaxID=1442371 RepID=A0A0D2K6N9_9EURO|nr:uncharacterized protein Z520_05280 [Fonsecaea multimorphosa CBS 102226]KIX98819.1 hypothetical protein Z520_05280 [Fonsecaea multimorphosa CBS 102226]OAL25099.1 hypothetical protein AYO22_04976 [Fonsecaea multimorphosa]
MGSIHIPSEIINNALGGLGVIGGIHFTVAQLREAIDELKSLLRDPSLPFGVDLLIPKVGGSARKTNVDYTKGNLDELVQVIIEGGAKLFVCAVGIPPKRVVDKLHAAGVLYMNMVGHPKHVPRACSVGADMICAQGAEAGGHTGEIPTSVLIPACSDICTKQRSQFTGRQVLLVAAGGIGDGRGLASALMLGADAVWVGTRFVTARESGSPQISKRAIIEAGFDSTIRSTFWTGRPLRALASPYVLDWETRRKEEMKALEGKGIVVMPHEMEKLHNRGELSEDIEDQAALRPMGYVSGLVNKADQTAAEIVTEMMEVASGLLRGTNKYFVSAKL